MNVNYSINVPIAFKILYIHLKYSKNVSLPELDVLYLFKFKYSIFDIHEQN